MNRWGFKKRIGNITFKDFEQFRSDFQEAFSHYYPKGLNIDIKIYSDIPHYTTMLTEFEDWIAEQNKRKIKEIFSNYNADCYKDYITQFSKKDFNECIYLECIIKPKIKDKDDSAFGSITCKGLLSKEINFYVQGVPSLYDNFLTKPSKFLYSIEDGYGHNASVSLR